MNLNRDRGKRTDRRETRLIEVLALLGVLLQFIRVVFRRCRHLIVAEPVEILVDRLRRFHRLGERTALFECLFEIALPGLDVVRQEPGDILLVVAGERPVRVILDRALDVLEEMLVVDDVPEILVLAVEPVHAADRLEERVVDHLLVDVEIGAGRRVKTRQQLVNDDQQLHRARMVDEPVLRPLLELLGRAVAEHVLGHLVLVLGLGRRIAGIPLRKIRGLAVIAGHDGAAALQGRSTVLEHVIVPERLIDVLAHEHRVAPPVLERGLEHHVLADVGDDTGDPFL